MRIVVTSVYVDDQDKALAFYTETLGFQKKHDVPLDEFRWLTLVSPEDPEGTELLLEPDQYPPVGAFKAALKKEGIPLTQFGVDDVDAEYERLKGLGVEFVREPMDAGPVRIAVLDDTCGNLIQIMSGG